MLIKLTSRSPIFIASHQLFVGENDSALVVFHIGRFVKIQFVALLETQFAAK